MRKLVTLLLLMFIGIHVSGRNIVKNAEELNQAVQKAKPGDIIYLQNKEWKDAALILKGKGTAKKWIVIMPESPGGVKLTGNSYLQLAGEYLLVKDLHFTNGFTSKREVISFRVDNNNLANHCRVSGIVIDNYSQPQRFKADTWITLYGKHNRIDHSTFVSKLNTGPLIIAELDDARSQENYHSIDSNYFKGRPRFGSNGGETIRIGVSRYSLTASRTSIMHNFFERCNGEVEFVSIKSGENRIAFNTFYECEGGLVLRHGANNIVEGNFFIGNNKPYTGGVRIVNPGHKVFNNVFYQLRGTNFRAPLGIMNGVPNSLINRYYQVKDVTVANNTFIDCAPLLFGAGKDAERTLSPQGVTFNNNLFVNKDAALFENANDDQGIKMLDNAVQKANEVKLTDGFKAINVSHKTVKGYNIPNAANYGAAIKKLPLIQQQHTGALWYQPVQKIAARKAKSFIVGAKQSKDLAGIVAQALDGDTIVLADTGYYGMNEVIRINKSLVLSAAQGLKSRPILVNSSYKSLPAFISIENGGRLVVQNIAFKGTYESFSDAKSGIQSTTLAMNQPYYLNVDGCEFYDFNESTQSGIEASKGTYADSLLVSNSIFHHISGSGINLSSEKDDKGIYNAENVIIKNCLFTNLLGSAINIYRGGNDESTLGPFVTIDHCTFNEVENREQGTVIKLVGAQSASVTNSSFYNSGQGGRSILFQEYRWDNILVDYCNFYHSGKVESFYNKVVGKHIFSAAPESGQLKNASSNQELVGATIKQ